MANQVRSYINNDYTFSCFNLLTDDESVPAELLLDNHPGFSDSNNYRMPFEFEIIYQFFGLTVPFDLCVRFANISVVLKIFVSNFKMSTLK